MFDVSWTDPTRETVGQRKSRKDQRAPGISRGSSVRSSKSDESNHTQARPSLLNLFGSNNTPNTSKRTLQRVGSHPKLSSLRVEDAKKTSRRISSYTVTSDCSANEFPSPPNTTRIPSHDFFIRGSCHSDAEQSSTSDVSESVFSGWTGRSTATDSTWGSVIEPPQIPGKLVQSLSATSFVTQSTEITVSPRDSVKADERIATVVSISAAPSMPIEILDTNRKVSNSSTFDFPIPNSQRRESIVLSQSPILGRAHHQQQNNWPMAIRSRNSDTWKPPETWDCPKEEQELVSMSPSKLLGSPLIPVKERRPKPPPIELSVLQRNIRRMEAASSKIILERLKEEWLEVADASVYRELELEKQLWMLTVLRGLKKKKSRDSLSSMKSLSLKEPRWASSRVLSLYENHASSSFLSALNPHPAIYHLSTSPLSTTSYPNIHPIWVPTPICQLPYGAKIFSSIHAFSLPAILPASSIPLILKECCRTLTSPPPPINTTLLALSSPTSPVSFSSASTATLRPTKSSPPSKAGTLHLTIIDPSPLPDTLGPKLRLWLGDHLILNLERQFRCINPGRLFPIWLADAGLRAEGSTIITVTFLACSSVESEKAIAVEEENVKSELKSIVGRMLWREMWGQFVEGDKWWWEDKEIVKECEEMGTRWEYAVIEAVKKA